MQVIKLKPLAKRSLSGQLFDTTGDYYNDKDYKRESDKVTHIKTGQVFVFASQEEENQWKELDKKGDELLKEFLYNRYADKKEPFIYLHNREQWQQGLKALQNKDAVIEMCEDAYWHFLECVPPKAQGRNSFVTGEPYTHNNEGKGVYLCAIEKDGKFFAQYGTLQQYRNNELFKVN